MRCSPIWCFFLVTVTTANHWCTLTTSYHPTFLFQDVSFHPYTFFLPSVEDKNIYGIHAKVRIANSPTVIGIPASSLVQPERFSIMGNDTKEFQLEVAMSVAKVNRSDLGQVVRNVTVVFFPKEEYNVEYSYASIEWDTMLEGYVWCQSCHRHVRMRENPTLGTYLRISDRASGAVAMTLVSWVCGMVILNALESEFLASRALYGLVCGKYNVERERWEWGCYPAMNQPIAYTNWADGEPRYTNDSACIYVRPKDARWKVVDCTVLQPNTIWQKPFTPEAGPISGIVTIAKPLRTTIFSNTPNN
eukprot:PhF_6_TR40518/c0_g3_i5/m.60672